MMINYCKTVLLSLVIFGYFSSGSSDENTIETYDLVVIGGGSAGLSCAKEAKQHNKSVLVVDYVTPSLRGTTWGIGGLCVNAGCIPKKLFHQAALLEKELSDSNAYGWNTDVDRINHNWKTLIKSVTDHIKSIRWKLRRELISKKIDFKIGLGSFIDQNTINVHELVNYPREDGYEKFEDKTVKGKHIVIAVGCRQSIPDSPKELKDICITSDDIFYMDQPPRKTLVIGGGYIAMEVAGFLRGLRFPVTVAVRDKILRNFDQQMVNLVKDSMVDDGVNFCIGCEVIAVEETDTSWRLMRWFGFKNPYKEYIVTIKNKETGNVTKELFNTIFCATGRKAPTDALNLDKVGVHYDKDTGKIPVIHEETNVPNIYAVGDVIKDEPELTPVAMKAGNLLAKRIFSDSKEKMDYKLVATVVFASLEYGRVGWDEEVALEQFGEDNIEVYHGYYFPLEWEVPRWKVGGDNSKCYIKVISMKGTDKIIGIHYTGPHAGDIIQGYAVAMKAGLTVTQLKKTVGIHPTVSEELVRISVTKSSGLNPRQLPCCS